VDAGLQTPERCKVVINLSNCRYPMLEEAAAALDWAVTRVDQHLGLGGARSTTQTVAVHQSLGGMHCPVISMIWVFCPSTRRLSSTLSICWPDLRAIWNGYKNTRHVSPVTDAR
jgi:hypothetical protein